MQANAVGEQPEESVDARVRRRLRELRTERGLTLQQVAKRASIDVSTLSRLESGKRRLALDHVPALAAALDVSTDALLGAGPPADPRVQGEPRVYDGLTLWPLNRRSQAGGIQAFKMLVSAERRIPPKTLPVHEGNDWLYVVQGRLRLLLGEDEFIVEPGEAVEFSTLRPHWFGAIEGSVEVIGFFGPQGQRVHLQG